MAKRVDQGSKKTSPIRRSTPPPAERSISPTPRLLVRNRFFSSTRRRSTILGITFIGLAASLLFWIHPSQLLHAATYTWTQTSWAGNATANTAVHPTNQTGWTEYSAKDSNVSTGVTVSLAPSASSKIETSDTDFNAGTKSTTSVAGTGSGSWVELSSSEGSGAVLAVSGITGSSFSSKTMVYEPVTDSTWYIGTYATKTPQLVQFNGNGLSGTALGSLDLSTSGIAGLYYTPVYDPTSQLLWVLGTSGSNVDYKLISINPSTRSIENTYTISGARYSSNCGFFMYDAALDSFWISSDAGAGPKIWKVNKTGVITQTISAPATPWCQPYSAYADSASDALYFTATTGTTLYKQPKDGSTATGVTLGGSANTQIAYDPNAPAIWTVNKAASPNGQVNKVLISNLSVTTYSSNFTSGSNGITYDAYHQQMLVSDYSSTSIRKVRLSDGAVSLFASPGLSSVTMIFDSTHRVLWSSYPMVVSFVTYNSPGTFTSQVLDTTAGSAYGVASWTTSVPASTTLTIKIRSSNSVTMVGAPAWNTCTGITSGQAMSTGGCITDGDRYLQYNADFTTSATSYSPRLSDITLNYSQYSNGTLTSSSFDTIDATNVLAKLQWSASGTGTVKFQLRTSADNNTWTSWLGPTGTGDYYTDSTGGTAINTTNHDGVGDRYIQYKAFLQSTDGISTPTLTGATMTYVVNAPPEFQAAPTAVQNSDGTVTISYSVRDSDTSTDTGSVGLVTPSFEYSTNNGGAWTAITTGLPASATTAKTVDGTSYTTYSTTWTAKDQLNGTYAAQTKIRVTVTDQQAANATAQGISSAFALDVKNPTLGSPAIAVNGSASAANISLNASDDSSLEMCVTLTNTQTSCQPYSATTTLALATNPDTVYVIYRDAFGNTASASAVTPETPNNLIIRDLSNLETNQYLLFISWRSVSTSLGEFGSYQIWHSTDGSSYTLLQPIADRSINYFLHQGLTDGSTHYYKVVSTDTHGNISVFSSVVSDTVNGQGGTDATPPTISHIVHTATTQTATITWDTDELANSTIGYSTTPGVFTTEAGLATMADTATGVGHHEIIIGGLTPNTTYYYRVQSSDPSGNTATSDNGGDGFAFTTTAGPTISNVTTPSIENTSAQITWQTNVPAPSKVTYSTSASLTNPSSVETIDEVTNHSLTLTNLAIGTRYYFQVQSGNGIDTNHGTFYSFVTTADTIAPVISNLSAILVTDTQALLRWETNERATSRASFGTQSGAYSQSTTADSVLNLTHSVTLNNLSPKTDYFVIVQSADAAGNTSTSSELKFSTSEQLLTDTEVQKLLDELRTSTDTIAPTIADVTVTSTDPHSAQATWSTNEAANSFLELTPASGKPEVIGDWVYLTGHTLITPTLSPATSYSYRVISADKSGNISTSSTASFTTPALSVTELATELEQQAQQLESAGANLPAPVIGGQPRVDVDATSATISWTTNTPTDGQVAVASSSYYQAHQNFEQEIASPAKQTTSHSVRLTNLQPDQQYIFRVSGQPKVGPPVTSASLNFQTLAKTFGIDNHTVEMISDEAAIFRWTTTEESTSILQYAPYRNGTQAVEELREQRDEKTNFIHQMTVTNFEPGVQYAVTMMSVNANGQQASLTLNPFKTEANDAPPVISNIRIDSALSPGQKVRVQTIVAWQTNKPTTSQVQFRAGVQPDADTAWEESTLDPSFTKQHIAILTTLKPGAVYQLQVKNRDSIGQEALSQPVTFLTPQQQQSVFQVILSTVQRTFGWTQIFK